MKYDNGISLVIHDIVLKLIQLISLRTTKVIPVFLSVNALLVSFTYSDLRSSNSFINPGLH